MARLRALAALATATLLPGGALPAADTPGSLSVPDPATQTAGPRKPASVRGQFTLVSVGDLLYSRPVAREPSAALAQVLDIVRSGDVAIGNQEGVFFDLKAFRGEAPGSGAILRGEPGLARDLKALGIDMVSTANNHSNDWGSEGLLAMDRLLDAAGIVHAGDGRTLAEARAPRYLKTPMGTVALVSTASTFKEGARAQDAIDAMPARTGISTLRTRASQVASADAATPAHFHYEMNTFDHYALLAAIREGKRHADLAVFTIHAHENADGMDDEAIGAPGDFLVQLFHDAVDAGADVVMGGGPHSLRGIEIYKGQPIFYGLGVFFINARIQLTQDERTTYYGPPPKVAPEAPQATARPHGRNPASWYDGIVASTTFRDGAVEEIRLYPLDLGQGGGPERKGLPYLAPPERARGVLEALQRASAPFGTAIAIEGSVGVIRPLVPSPTAAPLPAPAP